jgi:class 3 adenylate cyclase
MTCQSCGHVNGPDAKFCSECGTELHRQCPHCDAPVGPSAKFCDQCGTSMALGGEAPAERAEKIPAPVIPDPPRAAEAERRHLTVMFCDLVGSSAMSDRLDPEELRDIVRAYQQAATGVIENFGGHIAQYLGDGLLVYFGYPVAHEDDATRAVKAGLGVLGRVGELGARFRDELAVDLQVRIGVHAGLVVIGEVGGGSRRENLALGDVPNIAARLQGLAKPGELLISATTHRLVEGFFDCDDLGSHSLRGIAQPLNAYAVRSESGAQSRLDTGGALTPFVGREQEMGLLRDRWELVLEGAGQVILLNGEAGIGKSRFTQVSQDSLGPRSHKWIEARCSPYHENSALHPIIEMIRANCGCTRADTPERQVDMLRESLAAAGCDSESILPHFAALLDLPAAGDHARPEALPEQQRQRAIDGILGHLLAMADKGPIVFVVEDLHWADPSTIEFVTLLTEQVASTKILLLLTHRPVFQPPWRPRSHVSHVTMNRLPKMQMAPMIAHVAGAKALPDEVLEQIIERTDGVPLFVEELTKMVIETGLVRDGVDGYVVDGPLAPLAIPTTLHDSLAARLDHLAPVKEVAQLGAAIGREFGFELLAAVSPMADGELRDALDQLVEAELVFPRGVGPGATFVFKHALIRDTAYQSLIRSVRQQYHRRIATALEERFPAIAGAQPEVVAHHYAEAGLAVRAVEYWAEAGDRARDRSAMAEARAHLERGIGLLESVPDGQERDEMELRLVMGLAGTLVALVGYAAPGVADLCERARELAVALDRPSDLGAIMLGSAVSAMLRGDLQDAHGYGVELLDIATHTDETAIMAGAHFVLGMTTANFGRLLEADEHLDACLDILDAEPSDSMHSSYGQHPKVVALTYRAMVSSHLGHLDRGARAQDEALDYARTLGHPFTTAVNLGIAAAMAPVLRDPSEAQDLCDELLALTATHDFGFWRLQAMVIKGRLLVERGAVDEGMTLLHEGVDALGEQGGSSDGSLHLAEACLASGAIEAGLGVVRGVRAYMAEIHEGMPDNPTGMAAPHAATVEGALLAANALYADAERCFNQAIDMSRGQASLLGELLATMALARMRQSQGSQQEGHAALQAVYDRFSEGFEVTPLVKARILLDELSA